MSDLAPIAVLLADRTRARILEELLGGVALPAGALAARVGVAPSTVSSHLAQLETAELVTIERRGRRREARLAGPEVAEALEALGRLNRTGSTAVGLRAVNRQHALRHARSCYDHLAGRLGVAIADALLSRGLLVENDGAFLIPAGAAEGYRVLFGVDLEGVSTGARPLVRACSDWTERRPHVAGSIGAALLDAMLEREWLRRRSDGRALNVTTAGLRGFASIGISPAGDQARIVHEAAAAPVVGAA